MIDSPLLLDVGDWVLRTTIDVGLLVAALLLIERVAGARLGPTSRYLIWSLVLVRLLLPALPADPLGWKAATSAPAESGEIEPIAVDDGPVLARGFVPPTRSRPVDDVVTVEQETTTDTGAALAGATAETVEATIRRAPVALPGPAGPTPSADAAEAADARAAEEAGGLPWRETLVVLWAAVALAMLARLVLLEVRFRRALARDARPAHAELQRAVDRARRDAGMRRPVEALLTDQVPAPAVTGLLRPRLLMPPSALARLDAAELRHVLAHEVAHLRALDPLFRWAQAIAEALHWHNPLARLGLRRAQQAQEVLRDYQALGNQPGADPGDYAGTLLKLGTPPPRRQPAPLSALLEDGTTLKKRIQMVIDFPLRRGSALLGATLLAGLGWASLTGAATAQDPRTPPGPSAPSATGLQEIRVVRRAPVPEWKSSLLAKLETPIEITEEITLGDLARRLRDQVGVNVIVDLDLDSDETYPLSRGTRSARQILDLLREAAGCDWSLAPDVVLIDYGEGSANNYDLRFYDVRKLVDGDEENANWVQDIVYSLTPRHWENEYATMNFYNGLLVVNQSDRAHDEVLDLLELMLNRGRRPLAPSSPERDALAATLATPISVRFDEQGFAAVARALTDTTGVPIYVHPDYDDGRIVSLELKGMPLRDVLDWIGHQTWTSVVVEDGMVRFTSSRRPRSASTRSATCSSGRTRASPTRTTWSSSSTPRSAGTPGTTSSRRPWSGTTC